MKRNPAESSATTTAAINSAGTAATTTTTVQSARPATKSLEKVLARLARSHNAQKAPSSFACHDYTIDIEEVCAASADYYTASYGMLSVIREIDIDEKDILYAECSQLVPCYDPRDARPVDPANPQSYMTQQQREANAINALKEAILDLLDMYCVLP